MFTTKLYPVYKNVAFTTKAVRQNVALFYKPTPYTPRADIPVSSNKYLWHNRMGDISRDQLRKMGFPHPAEEETCRQCQLTKQV